LEIEIPKIALLPPKQSNKEVERQGLIQWQQYRFWAYVNPPQKHYKVEDL